MPNYAQLDAGRVVSVTQTSGVIDAPHMILLDAYDETLLGKAYVDGEFVDAESALPRWITQYAFRTRVTSELIATMELAAMHNPADAAPVQLAKAVQRAEMARCFAAQYIDLDLAELRAGFAAVDPADFARIFDAPVLDSERP